MTVAPAPTVAAVAADRPALFEGYLTPSHGASRTDALVAGLVPGWRLVASIDSPERLRGRGRAQGRWSFTAHLLATCSPPARTDEDASVDDISGPIAHDIGHGIADDPAVGTRWAVVVLWDGDWFQKDRHPILVQALADAAVEDTMPGLVRRFATDDRLPANGPYRDMDVAWPPTARWAVLTMLLEQPFPGRDAEQMLVDLTFGVGAVAHHRTKVVAEVAKDAAIASTVDRFSALREQARGIGFVREGWVVYRHESTLREAVQEHWDETTQSVRPGLAAAERAVWQGFFGDVLDDLIPPGASDPATRTV